MSSITAALLGESGDSALTATQLAERFRVDRDSVYRWRQEGLIPEGLVDFAGKRRMFFAAAAVPLLKRYFALRSGDCAGQAIESRAGRCVVMATVSGYAIVRLPDGRLVIVAEAEARRGQRRAADADS